MIFSLPLHTILFCLPSLCPLFHALFPSSNLPPSLLSDLSSPSPNSTFLNTCTWPFPFPFIYSPSALHYPLPFPPFPLSTILFLFLQPSLSYPSPCFSLLPPPPYTPFIPFFLLYQLSFFPILPTFSTFLPSFLPPFNTFLPSVSLNTRYNYLYVCFFFPLALNSCASIMPMKIFNSSLFNTFLNWNRQVNILYEILRNISWNKSARKR